MAQRGRHLARRPKARKMRFFGRAVPLALAFVMVMGAVASAADLNTSASLSTSTDTGTVVQANESNSFTIKVWAEGSANNDKFTGVAFVVNEYTMAGSAPHAITASSELADRTQLDFSHGSEQHWTPGNSFCPADTPDNQGAGPQGCKTNPFMVDATLVVADGVPDGTTGTLTVVTFGSTALSADVSPAQGFIEVEVAPTVTNSEPTLTSPGNQTVPEGSILSFTLSASDPDAGDSLTYSMGGHRDVLGASDNMSLNNSTGAFSWTPVDNYTDYTVTFRVTDSGGLYDEKTVTISSTNVAPTADFGDNGPKDEGTAVTVSFTNAADVSLVDAAAGFTYSFACDGLTFGSADSSASTVCTFGDNGMPNIKGRIYDKDGGYTEYTTSPTIDNVAPSKTAHVFNFNPYTGGADASVSFSDPGWLDEVTGDFSGIADPPSNSAGPGSGPGPLTGTFSTTQTYTGCITTALSVRVSDDDGGYFDHEFAAANTLGVRSVAFKAPLKEGTRNIAKLGNVIPIKLVVLDCHGDPIPGLTLTTRLVRGDVTGEPEVGETVVDATSVSSADTGNEMRYQDDGFYMYNLATKGLATGVPFTIQVRDGTQIIATALIELKK